MRFRLISLTQKDRKLGPTSAIPPVVQKPITSNHGVDTQLIRRNKALGIGLAAFCSAIVTAGCSKGGSTSAFPSTTSESVATTGQAPSGTTENASTTTNKWFPLEPGYQSVRQGRLNRGHRQLEHRRVFTVTKVTKEIDGMRALLVLDQDFDGGELAEQAVDYLAVDAQGNVLYLGSYTESYEGGRFVNASDAWLAGVKGAVRGTLVQGDPNTGTPAYLQTKIPGNETTMAKVIKTGQSVCVPFNCYTDVLVIQEGDEHKYFAPGVGGIKTEPNYSGGEQETEELINLTALSPEGLAEISEEALRLDQHARETAPGVFGRSQPAELAP